MRQRGRDAVLPRQSGLDRPAGAARRPYSKLVPLKVNTAAGQREKFDQRAWMELVTSRSNRRDSSKPARRCPARSSEMQRQSSIGVTQDRKLQSRSAGCSTEQTYAADAVDKSKAAAVDELFHRNAPKIRA